MRLENEIADDAEELKQAYINKLVSLITVQGYQFGLLDYKHSEDDDECYKTGLRANITEWLEEIPWVAK